MSKDSVLWAAALHDVSAHQRGEPTLATRTLVALARRNIRPIVELRCAERGHLLAGVHSTRHGLLLWTKPARYRAAPAVKKAAAEIAPQHFGGDKPFNPASFRTCEFINAHNLPDPEADNFPLSCRCAINTLVIADVFEAATKAKAETRRIVLRAPICGRN